MLLTGVLTDGTVRVENKKEHVSWYAGYFCILWIFQTFLWNCYQDLLRLKKKNSKLNSLLVDAHVNLLLKWV